MFLFTLGLLHSDNESAEKYYKRIFNYCKFHLGNDKEAAEECTQDVFIAYYGYIQSTEIKNVKAWLYHTADNYIHRYVRKLAVEKKKVISFDDDRYGNIEDGLPNYEPDFNVPPELDIDVDKCAEKIISFLKADEQKLYKQYFIENIHIRELTKKYGISEGAMRARIHRIREHIIVIIEQEKREK